MNTELYWREMTQQKVTLLMRHTYRSALVELELITLQVYFIRKIKLHGLA